MPTIADVLGVDLPWAVEIKAEIAASAGYPGFTTFHPTFLYESLWNLLILVPAILILEKRGKLAKSASFGLYVAMYAFIRFMMELMRTDTTFRFLGLSRNGWVSIAAFLFGVGWMIYAQRRGEKRKLYGKPTFLAPGEATEDLRPQTTDLRSEEESEDDDLSVPLSRGTGELASQGDERAERDVSRGTDEERSDESGG